jgi:GT2 family glycosyltransferase
MAGLVEILDERPMKPPYRENLETTHRLFSVPSMLIRRSAFVRVGFFNQDLTVVEDTEFMMRCRRMSISVKKVHVVSLIYRLHENNLSRDVDRNFSNTVDALRVVSRMRRQS